MTNVKMYFSYNNNEKVVEVPVVPNELPDILQEMDNASFTANTKTYTLLGNKKPGSFSMDLFLPTKEYDFAKDTGTEILNLLGYVSTNKIPMRIVAVDGLNELLNIAVSVTSFKYRFDTIENIRCSVNFLEYMFITESSSTEDSTVIKFQTVKTEINGVSTSISGVNVDGSNLVRARDILNLLGYEVGWNAEKKRVTANGILLDIHTEIYSGCAYCYVRDIGNALGISIAWDSDNKTVIIKG